MASHPQAPQDAPTAQNPRATQSSAPSLAEKPEPSQPAIDPAQLVSAQRAYFDSGATLDVNGRILALQRFYDTVVAHEEELAWAMKQDLGKSAQETYMSEVGLVLSETKYQMAHLRRWSKPQLKTPSLINFPATSFDVPNPKGLVYVMSPWNYPVMLALEPLVGAVAAGNCVIVRPSDSAPHVGQALASLIAEAFDPRHVACVLGSHDIADALLAQPIDHVFFTGSKRVGAYVMEQAAKIHASVTLELGGQSPCIVCDDAHIKLAARRIVFGKFLNCGQTCVCPDYVMVARPVHDAFVAAVKGEILRQFGENALDNPNWGKICKPRDYQRILSLVDPAKVVFGGQHDDAACRIAPIVMDDVQPADKVMSQEIFGPILPIMVFDRIDEVWSQIRSLPTPLAAYLFTHNQQIIDYFLNRLSFGSGCINDTIMQVAVSNIGFGGNKASGLGRYHGKFSFDTFTNYKAMLKKSRFIDLPMRYQPYNSLSNAIIRLLVR